MGFLESIGILELITKLNLGPTTIYWICLLFAVCLVLISAIFGEILDFAIDTDGGPFSGPVIATFLGLFGASGIILRAGFNVGPAASAVSSFLVALGGSYAFYYSFLKFILSNQGGTVYDPAAQGGQEAEVITTIPADGVGEITFDDNTGRISGGARSTQKIQILRGNVVVIDRFVGGVYWVSDPTANKLAETVQSETLTEEKEEIAE